MLRPFIERRGKGHRERGVTMALVALAITAIVAMAGMSIDIGTLYQASAEAQRAADAGALAGARTLSMSGMTGDPTNSSGDWTNACTAATNAATTAADQNLIGGSAPGTVSVTFLSSDAGGRSPSNCSSTGAVAFGVNPMVTVQVAQTGLPTFFSRIWGRTGSSVSATATAEAFNPSASENFSSSADVIPVQPRCVKPWIVPNADPVNGTTFVSPTDGSITHQGINPTSAAGSGVIGEEFELRSDCGGPSAGNCGPLTNNPPIPTAGTPAILEYVPATVSGTPVGVPSCATATPYQEAIGGCDETTAYQCGVQAGSASSPTIVDFSENPGIASGDTATATECLIHDSGGRDHMNTGVFPFQITAGAGNPLKVTGSQITSSDSIVSLPIYDSTTPPGTPLAANSKVTIVGFLQVFIEQLTGGANGHVHAYVMNVAGCGNGLTTTVNPGALTGTSPVPVRLITPP
jgi:Flp pilus assembly protein TadG